MENGSTWLFLMDPSKPPLVTGVVVKACKEQVVFNPQVWWCININLSLCPPMAMPG